MSIYYVFQGETYSIERAGNYVWSPQLDKNSHKNAGYSTMSKIQKGDFILHSWNKKIMAISIAKSDCYVFSQPQELYEAKKSINWANKGYRVDCEYFDMDHPVCVVDYKDWLKHHFVKTESAFTINGTGKQQYMCPLADAHAIFLLVKLISFQSNELVLEKLNLALSGFICREEYEYDEIEKASINKLVEDNVINNIKGWPGIREPQAMMISSETGKEKPKREAERAASALEYAGFICEYNNSDRVFLRKNGIPYTEPHHLIPISKYRDFKFSLDVMENIVSLCSHCHNLLHYGRIEDKLPILTKLYSERKDALLICGIDISFDQLVSYYK